MNYIGPEGKQEWLVGSGGAFAPKDLKKRTPLHPPNPEGGPGSGSPVDFSPTQVDKGQSLEGGGLTVPQQRPVEDVTTGGQQVKQGKPTPYNKMSRDELFDELDKEYTYVDDIVRDVGGRTHWNREDYNMQRIAVGKYPDAARKEQLVKHAVNRQRRIERELMKSPARARAWIETRRPRTAAAHRRVACSHAGSSAIGPR